MMILHPPFIITARLMPGLRIGDAFLSLDTEFGTTQDNRDIATFYLDFPADGTGHPVPPYVDETLKSGCGGFSSMVEAFEAYLGFLSACVESRRYGHRTDTPGENADLFPDHIGEWAEDNISEIECLLHGDLTDWLAT